MEAASAGLLVSFPDGMVSCEPGPELVPRSPDFCCGYISVFLQYIAIGRNFLLVFDGQAWLFLTHHMLGLLVSVPEGRVSCRHDHVLGRGLGLIDGLCRL